MMLAAPFSSMFLLTVVSALALTACASNGDPQQPGDVPDLPEIAMGVEATVDAREGMHVLAVAVHVNSGGFDLHLDETRGEGERILVYLTLSSQPLKRFPDPENR